jgi:uncharacterized protein (TIGR02996 family)
MTTLPDAFFHDIRQSPDDDTPRLVYADWLEENGDQADLLRAELIRLQCRLERGVEEGQRQALAERESELIARLRPAYFAVLDRLAESWELRRGLVERVAVSARQLVEHGEAIVRAAPVADLTLTLGSEPWHAVLGCEELRRVDRLEGRGSVFAGDVAAERLASSPFVGRLRELVLHNCGITEVGFASLLRLELSRLTMLNLGANNLHDAGMEMLCAAPALARLELLSLGANELHQPSARALAQSPHLRRLRDINLGANYLDDDAIVLLAGAENLASLRRLDVRSNEFHSRGALALARSRHLRDLEFLDVSGNHLTDRARAALSGRFDQRVHFS